MVVGLINVLYEIFFTGLSDSKREQKQRNTIKHRRMFETAAATTTKGKAMEIALILTELSRTGGGSEDGDGKEVKQSKRKRVRINEADNEIIIFNPPTTPQRQQKKKRGLELKSTPPKSPRKPRDVLSTTKRQPRVTKQPSKRDGCGTNFMFFMLRRGWVRPPSKLAHTFTNNDPRSTSPFDVAKVQAHDIFTYPHMGGFTGYYRYAAVNNEGIMINGEKRERNDAHNHEILEELRNSKKEIPKEKHVLTYFDMWVICTAERSTDLRKSGTHIYERMYIPERFVQNTELCERAAIKYFVEHSGINGAFEITKTEASRLSTVTSLDNMEWAQIMSLKSRGFK